MNLRMYLIGVISICTFTLMASKPEYEQGVVLVKFKAKSDVVARESVRTLLAAKMLKRYDVVGIEKWRLGKEVDALAAAEQLAALPGVQYAQPNYIHHTFRTPNDPRYRELWGMHNTDYDADIDAPAAWDIATGNNIIVAVVDSGVDYTHPDLKSNMWRNPDEIPANGIDDDHNGYVDDVYGIDACNGDTDPMDDKDHGSHCSGTIAGLGNNGVGIVGVCWSARIMACKFLDSDGSGSTADAIECIQYATRMGARVINASWGGGPYEKALFDAIGVANQAGILFCAAAGNEKSNNDDAPSYPASYNNDNILAVAATDEHDQLASFSCYGAYSVDLAAPGVSILSTVVGGGYKLFNGTSMATPHCSGAAALLLSINPKLSVTQLKAALMNSAVQKPALVGRCRTGARLNVFRAIQQVADPAIICPTGRKRSKGTRWKYKNSEWTWKYNDGTKSDRIIGKRVTPSLAPYLTDGWRIGIARVKDNIYYPFGPVYKLATRNNKSWSLEIKKNIKILYNAKSGALTCTIWTQLPPAWVVYVGSGNSSNSVVDVSGGPSATKYPVAEML